MHKYILLLSKHTQSGKQCICQLWPGKSITPRQTCRRKKKKEYNNLDSYWYITADKQIWNEPGTRPPPSTVETSFPKEPDLITKRTAKYNTWETEERMPSHTLVDLFRKMTSFHRIISTCKQILNIILVPQNFNQPLSWIQIDNTIQNPKHFPFK